MTLLGEIPKVHSMHNIPKIMSWTKGISRHGGVQSCSGLETANLMQYILYCKLGTVRKFSVMMCFHFMYSISHKYDCFLSSIIECVYFASSIMSGHFTV